MGRSKIASLLKSKAGASLAFFLAIMFFLITISGSVLVAAANARSTELERRKSKQIEVLAESITKSLNKAIVKEHGLGGATDSGLGEKIVLGMYKNKKDTANNLGGFDITPTLSSEVKIPSNVEIENIVITFKNQVVDIVPEIPEIKEGSLVILPRIPEICDISFQMTALISCKYKNEKSLNCTLDYDYANGYLEDGKFVPQTTGGTIYYGEWRLKNYAKTFK